MKKFILSTFILSLFVIIGCQKEELSTSHDNTTTEITAEIIAETANEDSSEASLEELLPEGITVDDFYTALKVSGLEEELENGTSRHCNFTYVDAFDELDNPICFYILMTPCSNVMLLNGVVPGFFVPSPSNPQFCVTFMAVPDGGTLDVTIIPPDGEECTETLTCDSQPDEEDCCAYESNWVVDQIVIEDQLCCNVTFSVDPECEGTTLIGSFSVDGFCDWFDSNSTPTSREITLCCQGPGALITFQGNLIQDGQAACEDIFTETYDLAFCQ